MFCNAPRRRLFVCHKECDWFICAKDFEKEFREILRVTVVTFLQIIVWEHWQWSMPDMAASIILVTLVMSIMYWMFERHLKNKSRWLSSGHAVQRLTPNFPPRSLSFLPAVFTELRRGYARQSLALSWYRRKVSQCERRKNWFILRTGTLVIASIFLAGIFEKIKLDPIIVYEGGVQIKSLFAITMIGWLQLTVCWRNCAVQIFQNEQKLKSILSSAATASEIDHVVQGDVGKATAFDYSVSERPLSSF